MYRDVYGNMTLAEKQAEVLQSYLDVHGLEMDLALQRDMIARYGFLNYKDKL